MGIVDVLRGTRGKENVVTSAQVPHTLKPGIA
jgi:hypothetical protein